MELTPTTGLEFLLPIPAHRLANVAFFLRCTSWPPPSYTRFQHPVPAWGWNTSLPFMCEATEATHSCRCEKRLMMIKQNIGTPCLALIKLSINRLGYDMSQMLWNYWWCATITNQHSFIMERRDSMKPQKTKKILPPGWGIDVKIRPINMQLVGNHEQSNISALEVSSWPLHHEHIPLAFVSLQNYWQKMFKITI